jgi:mono/diheme cytochrome c family protein
MRINRIKLLAIAILTLPTLALAAFNFTPTYAVSNADDDAATVYKAKCAACHSPKAEKFYNPEMKEEEQVDAILKGKKGEKPPNMPAFETKGITADQAKALAAYMKQLRTPAN